MKETWKNIPGYYDQYQASDLGSIRRVANFRKNVLHLLHEPRLVRPYETLFGYLKANICTPDIPRGRMKFVHRLVLMTFIGPCPKGHETSHLDGNRKNNKLNNLCWMSRSENSQLKKLHGTSAQGMNSSLSKLNDWQVYEIRDLLKIGVPCSLISAFFKEVPGFSLRNLLHINKKSTWRNVG